MIRQATHKDAVAIFNLAKEIHSQVYYKDIPIDEQKCKLIIAGCISSPTKFAWVSERDGEVQGVLLGIIDEILWSRKKEASDILFYVRPTAKGDGTKLAKKFMEWGISYKSVWMVGLSVSSGDESAEKLYTGLGLKRLGGIYAAVINREKLEQNQ